MKITLDEALDVYFNVVSKNCRNKNKLFRFERTMMTILIDNINRVNNNNYTPGKYNIFLIRRPKFRIVMSLSIIDKIINHVVTTKYLIPTLDKYLNFRNVATRKGMGADYGVRLVKKYIEENKKHDKFYVLKMDISKYFYNIDHNILKSMLKDKFDTDIYDLICKIIDSTNNDYVNSTIYNIKTKELNKKYNKDIDDIPYYEYDKGLPIGNMSSQYLAIYYMSNIDHYIVHNLKIKHYIRYMDDLVLIHHDKEYLEKCRDIIEEKLNNELKLKINNKTKIYDINDGFDFLSYNFKVINKKTIISISKKTYRNIKKNIKNLKGNIEEFNSYGNYRNSFRFSNNTKIKNILENQFSK